MTRKGRFPPLLARVTCLQQVINCIAYVAGVERDGGGGGRKGGIREGGFSLFPIALFSPTPPPRFMRLPRRLSTAVNAFRNVTPFAIQTASSLSFAQSFQICGGVEYLSTASSVLCGRLYERPDASTTLALLAALLLEYSNIPLPHRFSNKSSLEQKRDCSQTFCCPSPNKSTVLYQNIPF